MDEFLKQGGINLEEIAEEDEEEKENEEEKKNEYNTDADKNMSGWLIKSSIKVKDSDNINDDILGNIIGGIGSGVKMGLKMFTETIAIKSKKKYFALKNDTLYWYGHERARESENQVNIKEAKAIEINQ